MLAYIEPFVEVGRIVGLHGYKGEVKAEFSGNFIPKSKKMELVFVGFSPSPVPFFIYSKKQRNERTWIIQFRGVLNESESSEFLGKSLLLPKSQVKINRETDNDKFKITGFSVKDKKLGSLGFVADITDGTQQLLIVHSSEGREILIPAVKEFILSVNYKTRTIHCLLPDGLIEL